MMIENYGWFLSLWFMYDAARMGHSAGYYIWKRREILSQFAHVQSRVYKAGWEKIWRDEVGKKYPNIVVVVNRTAIVDKCET